MAANLGEIVLGGGGGGGGGGGISISGGGLIRPIGLGLLAVVSLFFMFSIAKKASVREQLPSAEELAGVPPMLESDGGDIIGEADEATPALEGMELDDDSLRRQQMLDQLNELASRDPEELSGILRRWMRNQD
jgi:flagellar biosynthesis/type III secretory pathway M-ring protein FliF/YscJ